MNPYTKKEETSESSQESEAGELRHHFDQLVTTRRIYEKTWDDLTEYYDPSLGAFVYKQQKYDPQRKSYRRLESTPATVVKQLMGRVNAELTGNSIRWFDFREADPKIDEVDEVRRCLMALSDRTYNILNGGSFRTAHMEFLINWIVYGTSCMKTLQDEGQPIFEAIPTREIYIEENKNGQVDLVYRKFIMKYRALVQFFGRDAISDDIHEMGEENPFQEFEVVHCVEPNEEYDATKKKNTKYKFKSRYLLLESNEIIKRGNFKRLPYVVARFWKRPGEVYGGSCAIDALPDVRILNIFEEARLRIVQRLAEPPWITEHDAVVLPLKISPNGFNYGGMKDGRRQIEPLFQGGDSSIEVMMNAMEQKRQSIRMAFFVDPLMNKSVSVRTAAEVSKRSNEETVGLTPFLSRLEIEYLVPLLEFTLDWVLENNRTIEIPPILDGHIPDIEFSAPLAKTQRGQELQNLVQAGQMIQNLAQIDPTVLQHVNINEYFNELIDLLSVNMKIVNTPQQVAMMQAAQQKQQQQQQQMAAVNEGMKTMSGGLSDMAKAGLVGRSDVGLPPLEGSTNTPYTGG